MHINENVFIAEALLIKGPLTKSYINQSSAVLSNRCQWPPLCWGRGGQQVLSGPPSS